MQPAWLWCGCVLCFACRRAAAVKSIQRVIRQTIHDTGRTMPIRLIASRDRPRPTPSAATSPGTPMQHVLAVLDPSFRLTDWKRVLVGQASWWFLLELCLRTAVTYLGVLAAMRLLGTRVAGQYTLLEMSLPVTIAAAVGVPLQTADRGLLPAVVLVLVLVGLQRLVVEGFMRNRRLETRVTTDLALLVRDGELDPATLSRITLPREKIFSALRAQGIQHLGQLSRLYLEPSGRLTVVPAKDVQPGLSVLPRFDRELREESTVPGLYACGCCGHRTQASRAPDAPCERCHAHAWEGTVNMLEQ
jgi:uncharacterized membrane protein YcaP (DUF421 family)